MKAISTMIPGIAPSSPPVGIGFELRARALAASATALATPPIPSGSASSAESADAATAKDNVLTPQEQQEVLQLKQIDRQVRAHEQAHLAVGGDLVRGGATFSYQTAPDQQRYAVAGEVSIDVSAASTPQETIPKAAHIRAAALAPADPSAQDQSVAAQAERMAGQARIELAVQQREAAVSTGQKNARFYQGGQGSRSGLGGHLDLYA